jgi:Secreted repeat of unknown function
MQRKLAVPLSLILVATAFVAARELRPSPGDDPLTDAGASLPSGWAIRPPVPDRLLPGAPGQTIRVSNTRLGPILVDGAGKAMYRFDEAALAVARRRTDPRIDPLPERRLVDCDGGTPAGWIPVAYESVRAYPGLDRRLLGYLDRADGSHQLTIRGCPIYRYFGDRTPGQIDGQARDGVWFAVTPTGGSASPPTQMPGSPMPTKQ